MINDSSIRLFILKNYIKYVNIDINKLSFMLYSNLKNKYLLYEEIIYNNKEGMIYKILNDQYSIVSCNKKIRCRYKDLMRKYKIDQTIIFDFLKLITYITPFGFRLLKKGIFRHMTTKDNIITYLQMLNNIEEELKNKNTIQKKESIVLHKNKERINIDANDLVVKNSHQDSENEINFSKKPKEHKPAYKTFKDIINNISLSEIFKIPKLDFETTIKLLRIYSFMMNFCFNKIYGNLNVFNLLRQFKEQQYLSEIIGYVHGFLIENLLKEKKNIGFECLITNIKSVMDSISEDFPSDEIVNGNEIGMKSWKTKVRNLLFDMYKFSQNKTILTFFNVLNKKSPYETEETIVMRIYLLEFLINCYMSTNIFRDVILNEINEVKKLEQLLKNYTQKSEEHDNILTKTQQKHENQYKTEFSSEVKKIKINVYENDNDLTINNKKLEKTNDVYKNNKVLDKSEFSDIDINISNIDDKSKIRNLLFKIVKSPAKTEIGNISNSKFILVNNQVFFIKNETIYTPSKSTLEKIIKNYESSDKAETLTILNLSNIVKSLY